MNIINLTSLFLAITVTLIAFFLITNKQYKWVALLIGSLFFYWFSGGSRIIFLVAYSLMVFGFGYFVKKKNSGNRRYFFLILLILLTPLLIYKLLPYLPGFSKLLFQEMPIEYKPGNNKAELVGLSFITFNAISYLVDIRRGYLHHEKNFFLFLLYLSFFPVIFSGPLHRAKNLLMQFRENVQLSNLNFSLGFRLILFGGFKNFVLAERLYTVTNSLTADEVKGFFVLIEGLSFFLYLYCIFSSYVDISRGIARMFGIKVDSNFSNRVYAASSRQEFWQGWHITLNNWFRDYFFFPLAKKLTVTLRINIALFLTFLLIGLWHGISFNFFLWGCLNGLWIILEKKFAKSFHFIGLPWRKWLGVFYHISLAIFLALIFSSSNLQGTYERLFASSYIEPDKLIVLIREFTFIVVFFVAMDLLYVRAKSQPVEIYIGSMPLIKRWSIYLLLAFAILSFSVNMTVDNYYFKF